MHDLSGRGPQALEFLIEGSNRGVGGGLRKSGSALQAHRGEKGERSVPGSTRRARVAQGACTVSRLW